MREGGRERRREREEEREGGRKTGNEGGKLEREAVRGEKGVRKREGGKHGEECPFNGIPAHNNTLVINDQIIKTDSGGQATSTLQHYVLHILYVPVSCLLKSAFELN